LFWIARRNKKTSLLRKREEAPVSILIGHLLITSEDLINVLGIIFDSRLYWSPNTRKAINN
jgi:hypothetical protein